uniref:Uncharacterized protein n=1 Tax=Sphingobacterium sp. (strain 21) TaxID=743722 RepID=F4CB44_SPHS2
MHVVFGVLLLMPSAVQDLNLYLHGRLLSERSYGGQKAYHCFEMLDVLCCNALMFFVPTSSIH